MNDSYVKVDYLDSPSVSVPLGFCGIKDAETNEPIVIPCRRKSDGAMGLYNTISKTFTKVD